MRKFYASANAICSHVKYASEITVLFLLETFCLPLLSYACEALSFSKQQLNQLNVCWNRAYRKAFHMRSWESVKELQALCERLDFKHLYIERKLLFLSKMLSLKNDVVQICFNCFNISSECCALRYGYDINVGRCSAAAIKEKVHYAFRNIAIAAV